MDNIRCTQYTLDSLRRRTLPARRLRECIRSINIAEKVSQAWAYDVSQSPPGLYNNISITMAGIRMDNNILKGIEIFR